VPVELLGRNSFPPVGDLPYLLTLAAHGFYWVRLAADAPPPAWHAQTEIPEERPFLVLFDGWLSFFRDQVVPWRIRMAQELRARLENEVLPGYLGQARGVRLEDHVIWKTGAAEKPGWLLPILGAADERYFVPLALAWEEEEAALRSLAADTVARVRQQAKVGVMGHAIADEGFRREVIAAIGERRTLATVQGTLRFTPTPAFDEIASGGLYLKCYRSLRAGRHPELELGRFLTEVASFRNTPAVAGEVEYAPRKGEPFVLALLQAHVANQGDGWTYTLEYLKRWLDTPRTGEPHGGYLVLVQALAARTAELHRAFAGAAGDPAFAPEPFVPEDFAACKAGVRRQAEQVLPALLAVIDACAAPRGRALKVRHHGDYHLGKVLLASNDWVITGFEAAAKASPLTDVAAMLSSFSRARHCAAGNGSVAAWEREVRDAFLASYAAAIEGSGLVESLEDAAGLLRLLEIERLLCELRAEPAQRAPRLAALREMLPGPDPS
jgi:maltose alpha-D-glucosyltransferase/alpha-amylase